MECEKRYVSYFLTLTFHFPQQQSKLEKADILEMTVKHLQNVQTHKFSGKCPIK